MRKRSWTIEQLRDAVRCSTSYRQVLVRLSLRPTGGNYGQLRRYVREVDLDTTHFVGQAWSCGLRFSRPLLRSLAEILTTNSDFQSFKLKLRLFAADLKPRHCEECGWAESAERWLSSLSNWTT